MFRIPSRVQKLLSQVLGFAFVVSSTLFANWVWQKYTTNIEEKNERMEKTHVFHDIVRSVIEETEYNMTPGIGDMKCPFHLESHHELLAASLSNCLAKETKQLVKEVIRLGGLCNGGKGGRKVTSAMVKAKSLELQQALQALIVCSDN